MVRGTFIGGHMGFRSAKVLYRACESIRGRLTTTGRNKFLPLLLRGPLFFLGGATSFFNLQKRLPPDLSFLTFGAKKLKNLTQIYESLPMFGFD